MNKQQCIQRRANCICPSVVSCTWPDFSFCSTCCWWSLPLLLPTSLWTFVIALTFITDVLSGVCTEMFCLFWSLAAVLKTVCTCLCQFTMTWCWQSTGFSCTSDTCGSCSACWEHWRTQCVGDYLPLTVKENAAYLNVLIVEACHWGCCSYWVSVIMPAWQHLYWVRVMISDQIWPWREFFLEMT